MTVAACPHGDHPACCLECLDGQPAERPNPPASDVPDGPVFPARYAGDCAACHLGIHEGQLIRHMADETYRHVECA